MRVESAEAQLTGVSDVSADVSSGASLVLLLLQHRVHSRQRRPRAADVHLWQLSAGVH
jgi:hypothetical protein